MYNAVKALSTYRHMDILPFTPLNSSLVLPQLEWLSTKQSKNTGEDVEKEELLYTGLGECKLV
jgi:hypothetical protein